jgi:hypothetical protein
MINIKKIIDEYLAEDIYFNEPWLQDVYDKNAAYRKELELSAEGETEIPEIPDEGGLWPYIANGTGLKLPKEKVDEDGNIIPRWRAGDPPQVVSCPHCGANLPLDVEGAGRMDPGKMISGEK